MKKQLLIITIFPLLAFADITEGTLLEIYGERIFRTDPLTLCIVPEEGDTVFFRDCSGNSDHGFISSDMAVYRVVNYLSEIDYWVIKMNGFDYGDWRVVNGITGEEYTVVSVPQLSPDGMRLLCSNCDITGCFTANGMQIWRLDSGDLFLEFEALIDQSWGPSNSLWVDDSTVCFDRTTYDYDINGFAYQPGILYMNSDGNWTLNDLADW